MQRSRFREVSTKARRAVAPTGASAMPRRNLTPRDRAGRAPAMPQTFARLSLSALPITETELKLMARAAIIGLSRRPVNG